MAKFSKSKDKKKNKGPKGKKARAKAKLDRQWGEEVTKEMPMRKGKSRILSKSKKEQKHGPTTTAQATTDATDEAWSKEYERHEIVEGFSSDDYDSDEDDNDANTGDDNGDGAYLSLIDTIRRNKHDSDSEDDKGDVMETVIDDNVEQGSMEEDSEEDEEDEPEEGMLPDRDPFTERFSRQPLPEDDTKRLQKLAPLQRTTKVVACCDLKIDSSTLDVQVSTALQETLHLEKEEPVTATIGVAAANKKKVKKTTDCWNKAARTSYGNNRELLQRQWPKTNKPGKNNVSLFTPLQSLMYPLVSSYADTLMTMETQADRPVIQKTLLLHILNHVLTSRGRIQKHNKKIHQVTAAEKEDNKGDNAAKVGIADHHDSEVWRDQGFTRPVVLILLPTRGTCYSLVQTLVQLLGDNLNVDNMDRFEQEYGPAETEEDTSTTGGGGPAAAQNTPLNAALERRRKKILEQKGPEWLELFGDDVNDDDDFKIGLSLNLKASKKSKQRADGSEAEGNCALKLYNDFYRSDIILASPLGLKMATSSEAKEGEADFLSSIEICLVARAEALLMQNWDHVNDVMNLMNQAPRNSNDTDFSRVRHYHLAGQSMHWRQLIVTSTFSDPLILSTFKRFAKSVDGVARIRRRVPAEDASISNVILPTRQVFQRIAATSFATQSQDRLDYFCEKVLPQILRNKQKHTLLFIPSYFDFVALRNVLLKKEVDFVSVTEYARTSEVSRGRARFLQGRKSLMLYTGRAHYFHRHAIKGIRHVVFVGLPEHASFYSEYVNLLNEELNDGGNHATASCLSLFTKYDSHALERVVGSSNCSRMVKGEKSTFLFAS